MTGTPSIEIRRLPRRLIAGCLLMLAGATIAGGCGSTDATRTEVTGTEAAATGEGSSGRQTEPTVTTATPDQADAGDPPGTSDTPATTGGQEEEGAETGDASEVPANAVAVVDGTPILRSELDRWLAQQRRALETQGATFPEEGSNEYRAIANQVLVVLVQHAALELEAAKQGVDVTEIEIDRRIREIIDQQFDGDVQRYQESLRRNGATDALARDEIRSQLLYAKLAEEATSGITVTDAEIRAAYEARKDDYTQERRREIAIILVPTREEADAAADNLRQGASFSSVAESVSRGGAQTAWFTELMKGYDAKTEYAPGFG